MSVTKREVHKRHNIHGCTAKCTRNIWAYWKSLEMGMGTPGGGDLPPHKTLCRLRIPPKKMVNINHGSPTKTKLGLLKTVLIQTNTTSGSPGENLRKNPSKETSIFHS